MLSILMTSDDFEPAATGVGTHLQTLAAGLSSRGHKVTVVTSRPAGRPAEEAWGDVRVVRLPTVSTFGFLQALPVGSQLQRVLDETRPDVVHHHYLGALLLRAKQLARRQGIPQAYTYHMTEDHLTQPLLMRPLRGVFARMIRSICEDVDIVITVSEALAKELPERGLRTPVMFISNAVDFGDAPVEAPQRGPDKPFTVLFVGRLNLEKNIPFLLRAFALLSTKHPNTVLRIAGKGNEQGNLEELGRSLGIAAKVQFLGFLDRTRLSVEYRDCDVFVLPSLVETQGLVAIEAMHFGKPIIVARSVITAAELVEEGGNGFIVEANDVKGLAERLADLAGDEALRTRLGRRARERSDQYDPKTLIDRTEAEYLRLARRSLAPAGAAW